MHCFNRVLVVMTVLSFAASSQAALVAHWNLDETTQGVYAANSTATPANAFLMADQTDEGFNDWRPTVNHPGVIGTSYHFGTGKTGEEDHIGSHLRCRAADGDGVDDFYGVTGTTNRTYAIWIKYDADVDPEWASRTDYSLMSHGGGGAPASPEPANKWTMRIEHQGDYAGALRLQTQHGRNTSDNYVTGSTILTDGQWHHAVVTMNGTDLTDNVFLYADGALEVESAESDNAPINTGTNVKLNINLDPYTHRFFPGWMDDAAIWDEALTSGEVAVLHDAAVSAHDYDASSFDLLRLAHADQQNVTIAGTEWLYSAEVDTSEGAGLNSLGQFVFDASAGTGMAVPEPGTLVSLLVGGLLAAVYVLRRRR